MGQKARQMLALLILYILILALYFYKAKVGTFNANYLSVDSCNTIKGCFIIVVFVRHIRQYMRTDGFGIADGVVSLIDGHIGQLLVVMFLLYSGYGVALSVMKKSGYVDAMPKRRILTTLLNFDVAVGLFLVAGLLLGRHYPLSQVLLSFTGWESLGNSNWYIFCILLCYTATYLSFKVIGGVNALIINVIFIVAAVLCLVIVKDTWWYDTLLAYPAGMLLAYKRELFEKVVRTHPVKISAVIILLFAVISTVRPAAIFDNVQACLFGILVVIVTMYVSPNSPILRWFGKHLFPLYIYQRLPMLVLSSVCGGALCTEHPNVYVVVCMVITVSIACLYRRFEIKIG